MNTGQYRKLFYNLLWMITLPCFALQADDEAPKEGISDNPGTTYNKPGTGALGEWLGLKEDSGVRLGGILVANYDYVFAGGLNPHKGAGNNLVDIGLYLDFEKLHWWRGGEFGAEFLQFNGRDANGEAGIVQGYDNLPVDSPFDRSELWQIWYGQHLFNKKLFIRVGKMATSNDFTYVLRPVKYHEKELNIGTTSPLTYTPIFVNPSMIGATPGYYESAFGVEITYAPTQAFYIKYGVFDGNVARGKRTGLRGPQFNGYYFHIGEVGFAWKWANRLPGNAAIGGWGQSGKLSSSPTNSEHGTGGFYFYGTQWLWLKHPKQATGVLAFVQGGINYSKVLPMSKFFGGGLSFFGLVPNRKDDTFGFGFAWSELNGKIFERDDELMLQGVYQAHLIKSSYLALSLTYVPHPGAAPHLQEFWAGTATVIILF